MSVLIDRIRMALATPSPTPLLGDVDIGVAHGDPPLAVGTAPVIPAAVLMPIIAEADPALLLTTRNANLRQHPGQVAFPGGRIDRDDRGPVAAALREAQEEIGLDPGQVQVLGLSDAYMTGTGYQVRPVVGVIPSGLELTANAAEVADIFQLPLSYALDPANHQARVGIWRGQERHYYLIEWQGHQIWGATAGMLVNLAARLS